MCGICGYVSQKGAAGVEAIGPMLDAIAHRGPDDSGRLAFAGPVAHAVLGSRRLSIIDLSERGRQPLTNEDGTVALLHNGEIYNFAELRSELEARGHTFSSRTDSEVLVHLFEEEGPAMLSRLNGMFGLAVYDSKKGLLFLARDRLGIKPLYYATTRDGGLVFASEIKSLLVHPAIDARLDTKALFHHLTLRYLPGPMTLFSGINKLPPGHFLLWENGRARIEEYWDIDPVARGVDGDPVSGLFGLMESAVRMRLMADVPVGVFLSGGLDSSFVLGMMNRLGHRPLEAFTVGMDEAGYSEVPFAQKVAAHFGLAHHTVRVGFKEMFDAVPEVVRHLDEPIADPAAVPLYFVARLAREKGFIVLLSGEGADELFAGYSYGRLLKKRPLLPILQALNRDFLHRLNEKLLLSGKLRLLEQVAHILKSRTATLVFTNREKSALLRKGLFRGIEPTETLFAGLDARASTASPLNRMLYVDTKTWLPEDLLMKADKTTMAHGIELRVPFLDHRVVQFAFRLPDSLKLRSGDTKWLVKEAAAKMLPEEIVKRPKMGFPVPIAKWFRGEGLNVVRDELLGAGSGLSGLFDQERIRWIIEAHGSGRLDLSQQLFLLYTFKKWLELFRPTVE